MKTKEEILTDAFYGRESTADSGINESEEEELEPLEDETQEVESEESESEESEDESEEEEEPTAPVVQKKKSNFAKIIAERNELRRKLAEKESKYDKASLDDIRAITREEIRLENEAMKKEQFFESNSIEGETREEVEAIMELYSMDVERAYKNYLLDTNPTALLDAQTIAKKGAKKFSVSGTPNRKITPPDPESPEELERINKAFKENGYKF